MPPLSAPSGAVAEAAEGLEQVAAKAAEVVPVTPEALLAAANEALETDIGFDESYLQTVGLNKVQELASDSTTTSSTFDALPTDTFAYFTETADPETTLQQLQNASPELLDQTISAIESNDVSSVQSLLNTAESSTTTSFNPETAATTFATGIDAHQKNQLRSILDSVSFSEDLTPTVTENFSEPTIEQSATTAEPVVETTPIAEGAPIIAEETIPTTTIEEPMPSPVEVTQEQPAPATEPVAEVAPEVVPAPETAPEPTTAVETAPANQTETVQETETTTNADTATQAAVQEQIATQATKATPEQIRESKKRIVTETVEGRLEKITHEKYVGAVVYRREPAQRTPEINLAFIKTAKGWTLPQDWVNPDTDHQAEKDETKDVVKAQLGIDPHVENNLEKTKIVSTDSKSGKTLTEESYFLADSLEAKLPESDTVEKTWITIADLVNNPKVLQSIDPDVLPILQKAINSLAKRFN